MKAGHSGAWARQEKKIMESKQSSESLEELRGKIDKADQMLLSSFVDRMRVSADIARYKKENGLPVLDASREQEKLDEIRKLSPSDMEDSCVMLYNKIMELSRELQEKIISE